MKKTLLSIAFVLLMALAAGCNSLPGTGSAPATAVPQAPVGTQATLPAATAAATTVSAGGGANSGATPTTPAVADTPEAAPTQLLPRQPTDTPEALATEAPQATDTPQAAATEAPQATDTPAPADTPSAGTTPAPAGNAGAPGDASELGRRIQAAMHALKSYQLDITSTSGMNMHEVNVLPDRVSIVATTSAGKQYIKNIGKQSWFSRDGKSWAKTEYQSPITDMSNQVFVDPDAGYTVTMLDDTTVDGRPAGQVHVKAPPSTDPNSGPQFTEETLQYDKATYRVLSGTIQMNNPQNPSPTETIQARYSAFDSPENRVDPPQ